MSLRALKIVKEEIARAIAATGSKRLILEAVGAMIEHRIAKECIEQPEPEESAVKFGFCCQTCGEGTVQLCVMPYATKIRGNPFTIEDAKIGVCDQCGESHFCSAEYKRWRRLYDDTLGPDRVIG